MLSKEGCRARLVRLLQRLETPWDAIVFHRPEHLLYFANFFPEPTSLNLHSSSFLLVERDGPTTLFTDNWLEETERTAVDETESVVWYDCRTEAKIRSRVVAERLCDRLRDLQVKLLAAELSCLPVQVASVSDRVLDIEPTVRSLREVKDPDEIVAIRKGIRAAEAVHAASRDHLEAGISEIAYYGNLLQHAVVAAGTPFVMMCDLASGPRAAAGGGAPTERIMREQELVILDMFPYVGGYRGDITNTLVVGGKPSAEQEELFAVCVAALDAGAALLRPGTPVREIYHAVDSVFVNAGREGLPHHAGHAIGLGHPEAPEIVPETERLLEEGMVLTLEPGVYNHATGGIRIEHDYLITSSGHERLSSHRLGLS